MLSLRLVLTSTGIMAALVPIAAQPVLRQPFVGARVGAAMAYDSTRNELLVVGGSQDFTAQTWRRGGMGWSTVDSPAAAARVGARMVYDTARQRAVLFGGVVGTNVTRDLFEWDGSTWIQHTAVGPRAQHYVGMAYDSGRGRTVWFDGQTWEWDGTTWLLRATGGPPGRAGAALAYDAARQRTVLFGGNVDPEAFAGTTDTWEWDGTTWRQIATPGPSARGYTAMAYSPSSRRIVLFGGRTSLSSSGNAGDTWEFDGSTWTLRTSNNVPGRALHTLAWDSARQRVVMFGGETASGPSSELWSWDGAVWTLIEGGPSASYVVGRMTFDAARSQTVYYGGSDPRTLVALGETWTFDGTTWRRPTPATMPPPRHAPAMTFDPVRRRVLLVGGAIADHWEWDGTNWQQFTGTVPGARSGAALAFDTLRQRAVLFGGYANGAYLDETWEFDGVAWSRATPSVNPPARSHAQMAWDPSTRSLLLFGGVVNGTNALADTWLYDGRTWLQATPATVPAARLNGYLLTDSLRGRCVLAGGGGYTSILPYELWDWDGVDWELRGSEPRLRTQAAATFDVGRGRIVVQEGNGSNRCAEFAFLTDVVGQGNVRLSGSVATVGGILRFDVATNAPSLLLLASVPIASPPWLLSGGPFCGSEPLFVPPGAALSLPFVGPVLTLPVPNVPEMAFVPLLAQAAVALPGNCVALSDAVALRTQPR
ncbi:MAG: hypothetical protein R3F56_17645 [Planctomycetota bacterium]